MGGRWDTDGVNSARGEAEGYLALGWRASYQSKMDCSSVSLCPRVSHIICDSTASHSSLHLQKTTRQA